MAKAQQAEQDEFEAAASDSDYVAGYLATAEKEVEDQREYKLIPAKTPCELGIVGFTLATARPGQKAKPAILCKIAVHSPEEYADGSSNFTQRLSLNPVVGTNEDGTDKKGSGWDMTSNVLSWLYAAVHQVPSAEGKAAMVNAVLADFPNMSVDDVPVFHQALVDNANEQLKGRTFRTKSIGLQKGGPDGKGGNYPDRQEFGVIDYPKSEKK